MTPATTNSEADIFARLIDLEKSDLSADLARQMLKIGFKEPDQARMNELAAKAQDGTSTDAEQRELESYNLVGDLLALWHSQARRALKAETTAH